MTQINNQTYEPTKYGWKQLNPQPFDYNHSYLNQQSTNLQMAWLRIGYLISSISNLNNKICLELGPGTGVFFKELKPLVKKIDGFDVSKESKYHTTNSPKSRHYDILLAFDVIEHFQDINELWEYDFKYGFISLPHRPREVTADYKHLKPNEHLWHINAEEMKSWLTENKCKILSQGFPEDLIRTPWSCEEPNIMSFIFERKEPSFAPEFADICTFDEEGACERHKCKHEGRMRKLSVAKTSIGHEYRKKWDKEVIVGEVVNKGCGCKKPTGQLT